MSYLEPSSTSENTVSTISTSSCAANGLSILAAVPKRDTFIASPCDKSDNATNEYEGVPCVAFKPTEWYLSGISRPVAGRRVEWYLDIEGC